MRVFAILVVLVTAAAAETPRPAKVGAVETLELRAQPAIIKVVRAKPADLAAALQQAYLSLVVVAHKNRLDVSGAPFAIYLSRGTATDPTHVVQAGLPLSSAPSAPLGDEIERITLPAGPAAAVVLRGRHDQIGKAHEALDAWLTKARRAPKGPRRELYITNPITTPDPSAQEMRVIAPLAPQ